MTIAEANRVNLIVEEISTFENLNDKIRRLHNKGDIDGVSNIALELQAKILNDAQLKLKALPSPFV